MFDSIVMGVNLLALNLALASVSICVVGLVITCLCRRCSLPLHYALLSASVLLVLLCPLPVLFGTCLNLGVIEITGSPEIGVDAPLQSASAEEAIRIATRSEDQHAHEAIDSSAVADQTRRVPEASNSNERASETDSNRSANAGRQSRESQQFAMHWRNGNIGLCLVVGWLSVSLFCLYRLAKGLSVVRGVHASINPTNDVKLIHAMQLACRALRPNHRLLVFESDYIQSPMTLGIFRPVIVVPNKIAELLSDEELVCILSHELAHIMRRDTVMAFCQQLALAIFWWNPLLRIAIMQSNRLRERICDDYIVSFFHSGRVLAEAIVKLAEWSTTADFRIPLAHTLFGYGEDLKVRISRLSVSCCPRVIRLDRYSGTFVAIVGALLGSSSFMPVVRAQVVVPSTPNSQVPNERSTAPRLENDDRLVLAKNAPLPEGAVLQLGKARFRHSHPVDVVAYSPDGRFLATGSFDKFIRLWDARTGVLVRTFADSDGRNTCGLAFAPEGQRLVSLSSEGRTAMWNYHTGERLWERSYQGTHGPVVFFPDSSKIAFAERDENIVVRDAATGEVEFEILKPDGQQSARAAQVAIAPDGAQLAFGSGTDINIVDLTDNNKISVIPQAHGQQILSLEYTPDSKHLLSCGTSRWQRLEIAGKKTVTSYHEIRSWSVSDRSLAQEYIADKPDVGEVRGRLSPDGGKLYTIGYGVIRIWNVQTGKQIESPIEYRNFRTYSRGGLVVSPDGGKLVACGPENELLIWDLQTGERLGEDEDTNAGSVGAIAYSPDGAVIAAAGSHGKLKLWDRASGRLLQSLELPTDSPGAGISFDAISISPDGQRIATTGATNYGVEGRGVLTIWDRGSGNIVSSKVADRPGQIVYHGWDGDVLVTALGFAASVFGGPSKAEPNLTFIGSDSVSRAPATEDLPTGVAGCYFDSDRETVRYVDFQTTLHTWDLKTNIVRKHRLKAERDRIRRAVFAEDGSVLVTNGLFDSKIYLWETQTGRETLSLTFDGTLGVNIALSPDKTLIAATPTEIVLTKNEIPRTVKVWDTKQRNQQADLKLPFAYASALAFSPDGTELVVGHQDGTITVWALD